MVIDLTLFKTHELRGANVSELLTQVNLLTYEAFPRKYTLVQGDISRLTLFVI